MKRHLSLNQDEDKEQLEAHEHIEIDEKWMKIYLSEQVPLLKEDMQKIRNKLSDSLILDIGGGSLFPTAPIKLLFKPKGIVTVDFSRHLIKDGGDLTLKILETRDESIFRIVLNLNQGSLPFVDSVFDFVVGRHILHHLENPQLILKEARRVLKPKGMCWFLETCEPYIPLFTRNRAIYSPFRLVDYFRRHRLSKLPKKIETEAQCLRQFDRPKHYYEWKRLFSRLFLIEYFGYAPSSEYQVENMQIFGRMPKLLRKLATLAQFYTRVALEYPSVLIIGKKGAHRDR